MNEAVKTRLTNLLLTHASASTVNWSQLLGDILEILIKELAQMQTPNPTPISKGPFQSSEGLRNG